MLNPDTPRLALIIAPRPDLTTTEVESGLRALAARLREPFGTAASVRVALRVHDDPLGTLLAQRGAVGAITAELELTLARGADPQHLLEAAAALRSIPGSFANPPATRLVAGSVYFVREGDGPFLVLVGGRRAPGTTATEMTRWWIDQHAVLVSRIVQPPPRSYEQLHGDRALSARLCDAAGIEFEPLDMWDSIAVGSVEEFLRSVSDPQVGRQLYEDEMGHVDHPSMRGALCRVL